MQTLIIGRRINEQVDSSLENHFKKEEEYWIKALKKVLSDNKFLLSRPLALCADNKLPGSQYIGNYLGHLKLLPAYDPFLNSHLTKFDKDREYSSSLSSMTCTEIFEILADKVLLTYC